MTRRAIAAAAALLLLAACQGKSKPEENAAPAESPFLLPTFLPPGFHIQAGAIQARGPAHNTYGAAVGKPSGDGTFEEVILVTARDAQADREVAANEKNSSVDVNGIAARLHDDAVVGAYVDWFADGAAVAVSGGSGTGAVVTDVARRLRGSGVKDISLASTPPGYDRIAGGHFIDHAPEAGTTVQLDGPSGAHITMTTAQSTVPLVFVVAGGDRISPLKVRGHDALVSVRVRQLQATRLTQTFIAWRERPGVVVSLIASTSVDQLLPVANGLATVAEAVWRQVVPQR